MTLWVYGTKVQATGLADSGATTTFIDRKFVDTNHLVTNKLARPYDIKNADGTLNVAGQIRYFVRALVQIGEHKSTIILYVTDLGDKDLIIGYDFLYQHNPEIDWRKGEWEFTRCDPKSCTDKARKLDLSPRNQFTEIINGSIRVHVFRNTTHAWRTLLPQDMWFEMLLKLWSETRTCYV